ncbi:MAG: dihydroorotase, partial [Elusimicrobia bacterium]|nr:dihydroorotase [Elusimicrobiota bacterium]
MPANSLLIAGGTVIDPEQRLEAARDVLIKDGRIEDMAAGLAKKERLSGVARIEAAGCWVTPGLIDMHVHLREPGGEADETIASGTRAAARGGVASVLAMPNTEPPIDSPALARLLAAKAREAGAVNVLVAGALTLGQKGERLTEAARLKEAGAVALSDDGRPVMDSGLMRRAMEYARDAGLLVIDHCEDASLSQGGCLHEGAAATAKGLRAIPWASETVMVLRDIALCELTQAPIHLAHLSCAQSVAALRSAKKRGLPVSAEATPHHLLLCEDDMPGYDADFKMNPPLRGKADRQALLEALADGTIDAIATDHAPHGCAAKGAGLDLAPFGVIGLETSLAVALTTLYHAKVLTRRKLVERMSAAPARLLGLASKGTLAPGSDADLAVVDPDAA